jgi:hypothetical protein
VANILAIIANIIFRYFIINEERKFKREKILNAYY